MFGMSFVEIFVIAFVALRRAIDGSVRVAGEKKGAGFGSRDARQTSDERYARGELSGDEYRLMRRNIGAD